MFNFAIDCVRFLKKFFINFIDYLSDCIAYTKESYTHNKVGQDFMEGRIIAHYHVLEKGLSFREIKNRFGLENVFSLIRILNEYISLGYSLDNKQFLSAISSLKEYIEIHRSKNISVDDVVSAFSNKLAKLIDENSSPNLDGGSRYISRIDNFSFQELGFKEFNESRHTVRDFTDKDVDFSLVEEAINIARYSPSVCNRQTTRIILVSDRDKIRKHLSYQNGNRGFGNNINKLLIVVSDVGGFLGSEERNQSYIDAGLFSMNLLHAIHYLGLGGVALNWAVKSKHDRKYRKEFSIPNNFRINFMIGIGVPPEHFKVPVSKKRDVSEILIRKD